MTTEKKKKLEKVETPSTAGTVLPRIVAARLSQFAPNPDKVEDWAFNRVYTAEYGKQQVTADDFDLELQGEKIRVTSRKTGASVLASYDWVLVKP